jgi:hypothetical protein
MDSLTQYEGNRGTRVECAMAAFLMLRPVRDELMTRVYKV